MKKCSQCQNNKPYSEFGLDKKSADKLTYKCKDCRNIYQKEWNRRNLLLRRLQVNNNKKKTRDRLQRQLWDFLKDKACLDCGITNRFVFQFDHRGDKEDDISSLINKTRKWEVILKEIEKCDIVCANCHQIRTMKQFNWNKSEWI